WGRRTGEARMPGTRPRSGPYFQAVSIWRWPSRSALATISPQSPKEEVPKPMAGISAPCADNVGIEGEAIDGRIRTIGERTVRSARQGSIALARQDVTPPEGATIAHLSRVSVSRLPGNCRLSQTKAPPWQAGFGIVRVYRRREPMALGKFRQAGMRASSSDGSRST